MPEAYCPECGAAWADGQTCTDLFHQMGFWELDYQLYEVHHLMVLCYHLQHPGLYSPEGLAGALKLLIEFVEGGITPQTVRRRETGPLDSGVRNYRIKGTPESHAEYMQPVRWEMTAADVVAGGIDHYYENVQAWAGSVLMALRESAILAPR